jgi:benzylsuccinate CoA-transferase BbsF subunit
MPEHSSRMPDTPSALSGLRVVDLSQWAAAPLATKVLADFGAEVIKVESMTGLDGGRMAWPLVPGVNSVNVSAWCNNYQSSKLSVTINLNEHKGRDLLLKLVHISDVVVDSYPRRIMERWSLTYEELAAAKPDIIVASMPMMGSDGPYRDFRGFGNTIAAMTSLPSLTGDPCRPPVGTGTAYTDYTSGSWQFATAILAALHHRDRTGTGQYVELSQFEAMICFLGVPLLNVTANQHAIERIGNRSTFAVPHGVYRCRGDDRWCALAVRTDQEWSSLCSVLGHPPWTRDNRFATFLQRKKHEDALDELITTWTEERPAEEVMFALQHVGVPAGVVQNVQDLLENDVHMRAREHYISLVHAEAGKMTYDAPTFKLSLTPGRLRSPAPLLGEHNEYVLGELLGMTEDAIGDLVVEGIVQ